LQEVLFENVDNMAPYHFVDVFDGNDVLVNGVPTECWSQCFMLFEKILLMVH
jgi:hypothetical protein